MLFLSVVGLKSGGDFVNTLVNGEGLSWIAMVPRSKHRRSADYCWHSGADVSQNELPDHVRDAGQVP